MNQLKYMALAAIMGVGASAPALADVNFSYAPAEYDENLTSAIGSGMNYFVEGAIAIDAADPASAPLKGYNVLGVRVYMRADYLQADRDFSCVTGYIGTPDDTPDRRTTADLRTGWNEVMFDSPIPIGDEPVYVGARVFETKGVPYPFITYSSVTNIPQACNIRVRNQEWELGMHRGCLFIQAIIDAPAEALDGCLSVAVADVPLAVRPDETFSATAYVANHGSRPVTEVTLLTDGKDLLPLTFSPALAPGDARAIPASVMAPAEEGVDMPLSVTASLVDGNEAHAGTTYNTLLITADAFPRIPVVEEFTGLTCPNCPYMTYFLDRALQIFGKYHVYIAHHAGYQKDPLTQPVDEALLYLFGPYGTSNPAAMFDRRRLEAGPTPIIKANQVSTDPYTEYLAQVMAYPAQAEVFVDLDMTENSADCRVYGRVARSVLAEQGNLRITTYLLEDDISTDIYPQQGVNYDWDPTSPEDLVETFRHNGVIRHVFTSELVGDVLDFEDDGTFDITYPTASLASDWNSDNLKAISFIHFYDTEDLGNNYVLNSGCNLLNDVSFNGLECVGSSTATDLHIFVDCTGRITCSDASATLTFHDLQGRPASADASGLILVTATRPDGVARTFKVLR